MPTRDQVVALIRGGMSYQQAGDKLGILPGQAYLIATGLPADGSDVLTEEELSGRAGLLEGSSQHLANPPTEVPTTDDTVMEWMRSRARADLPMQQAAAARTAEPPPVRGEDETDDVISVLGWDHNQVKYLDEQLQAIPGVRKGGTEAQQRQRVSIVDMIRVRLSEHEAVEEEYFWPAVRKALPDGDDLAAKALEQEQQGKELLQHLARLDGGDDEFDELVEKLILALRTHVAFEDQVFLKVEDALSEGDRDELGRKIRKAKGGADA